MAVQLKTTGLIAKILGVGQHQVDYVLQTRPHIKHVALAGNVRLYDNVALAQIRHELTAIQARRLSRQEVSHDAS